MLSEGRSLSHQLVISRQGGIVGTLEVGMCEAEPAICHQPARNISNSEMITHDVWAIFREMLVHQAHNMDQFFLPLRDVPWMVVGCLLELPAQKRSAQCVSYIVCNPVHPFFNGLPRRGIVRKEVYSPMLGRQLPNNRVRLSHNAISIDYDRNLPCQVQLEKFLSIGRGESSAIILPPQRNADFIANPENLANIE